MLSIILDEEDLKLADVKVEQVILNSSGKRAIRLDAWAVDAKNRQFKMEMQNDAGHDELRKRSKLYQGLLDTPILKSGKKITEQCEEIPGLLLSDGTKKIPWTIGIFR